MVLYVALNVVTPLGSSCGLVNGDVTDKSIGANSKFTNRSINPLCLNTQYV